MEMVKEYGFGYVQLASLCSLTQMQGKALIEKLYDHPMSTGTSLQVTYLCSGYKETLR